MNAHQATAIAVDLDKHYRRSPAAHVIEDAIIGLDYDTVRKAAAELKQTVRADVAISLDDIHRAIGKLARCTRCDNTGRHNGHPCNCPAGDAIVDIEANVMSDAEYARLAARAHAIPDHQRQLGLDAIARIRAAGPPRPWDPRAPRLHAVRDEAA